MTATILRGDARRLPLADASVDLVVTSPPYWALRSYTDGGQHYHGQIGAEPTPAAYIDSLIECTAEWMRVLRPEGSLWVNLGDKYSTYEGPRNVPQNSELGRRQEAAGQVNARYTRSAPRAYGIPYKSLHLLPERYRIACVDRLGLIARAVVIWSKPNGLPESVTDRVRRSHEDWVHLVKQPRYFAAVDAIREAHAERYADRVARYGGRDRDSLPSRQYATGDRKDAGDAKGILGLNRTGSLDPLGKLPGSVREVATQPLKVPAELGIDHFAAFPMEWPRWIITGWSPSGGTIVDPFGGTGTTALLAHVLGRHGVSVDMSRDYCRLARWRTTDPGQLAAAMQVEKPPVVHSGQLDLFAVGGGA